MEEHYGVMHRRLSSALEVYDTVEFTEPDLWFNQKAPRPLISFIIGLVILLIYIYQTSERFNHFNKRLKAKHNVRLSFRSEMKREKYLFFRMLLTATMNSGNPVHTVIYHFAHGFIFLGLFQLDYERGYYILLIFNAIVAIWDTIEISLDYREYDSLNDLINRTGSYIFRDAGKKNEETTRANNKIVYNFEPTNVYQNVGRENLVVLMIFITQIILIGLVAYDTVHNGATGDCLTDKSPGCPTVGTRWSWSLYVLGIFLQCVYLVGPKTGFGQSQQNPVYWLCLSLANKNCAASLSSSIAREHGKNTIRLREKDWKINLRLFASYIINGLGFRLLLHTLPIQIAFQSSILGIVFRSVGMIFLVNLDDSKGVKLQLMEPNNSTEEGNSHEDEANVVNYYFKYDASLGLLYDKGMKPNESSGKTSLVEIPAGIEVLSSSSKDNQVSSYQKEFNA